MVVDLGGVHTLHVDTVIILLYVTNITSSVHVKCNLDRLNKMGMVAYLGVAHPPCKYRRHGHTFICHKYHVEYTCKQWI